MSKRVSPQARDRYVALRQSGNSQSQAARDAGVSRSWAHYYESQKLSPEVRASFPRGLANSMAGPIREKPVPREELCAEAERALGDFEYFRVRYFGRRSTPWQVEAGHTLCKLLATDDKEFVVINCPPGAGKSTLLRDIMMWLICRDRSVRLLMGSRTQRQANSYSGVIKQTLERKSTMKAKEDEKRLGLAVDAESFLALDFGPFRPSSRDEIWRREQFTVVQGGETPVDEKESTVTAFGMDAGQLGWRVNGGFWDDLVDKSTVRTEESQTRQEGWYEDEAETRIEPGGLMTLCGQRISSTDLYRHCLDMTSLSVTELDAEGDDVPDAPRKYHHIVYKAHDETKCTGDHQPKEAKPWPDGCLLDPIRLPWRELRHLMGSRERKYRVLYQQEDTDPAAVLVSPIWVSGGTGEGNETFPGCWDTERRLSELPKDLERPLLSIATADPSPTKYWGIEWWVYQPSTGLRYLMDLERRSMSAPEFLDWNDQTREFHGLMHEWFFRSAELGLPITHWIVEANAAQRFILQFEHFRRWQQFTGARVIAHQTSRNKADPELGVEAALAPIWRRGLVRLPGSQDGITRTAAMKLVDEVTRYPDGGTTDLLMAQWFLEYALETGAIRAGESTPRPPARRPKFLARRAA